MYALTSTLALTAAAVFSTSAVSATTQQLPKRGVSVLATSVSNSVPVTNYLTSAGVGHCGVQNADSVSAPLNEARSRHSFPEV